MFFKSKNVLVRVLSETIAHFGINRTERNLTEMLESNLENPSLLVIKDILSSYGLQSAAVKKGKYSYEDFETPYISVIQQSDWSENIFTVVTRADNGSLDYFDPVSKKSKSVSLEDFEKIDKGYVLLLDGDLAKDEHNFVSNRRKERFELLSRLVPLVLVLLAILSVCVYAFLNMSIHDSWLSVCMLFSCFIGFVCSLLLLWHEIDEHNPLLKEVCGGNKRKISCGAVLSSSGAKFLGISWSVWGAAYFTTFLLTQLLFANQPQYLVFWIWLSVVVSPYIIFSLFYQWKVLNRWCPLCLAVQGVLFLLAIVSLTQIIQNPYSAILWYTSVASLGLGIGFLLFYNTFIPLIKSAKDSSNYKQRLEKLRFNPSVFQSLLANSEVISNSVDNLGLIIGSPDAKQEIVKVCNPYCEPCAKAHPELEQIVKENPDVKVRVIFTASGDDDDIKTKPVAHLLAIEHVYGSELSQQALDDWYLAEKKDYESFAVKYPMNGELEQQTDRIKAMRDWCDIMKIRATPTIFINGYEMPDGYRVDELKNLLQ